MNKIKNLQKKILLSITGGTEKEWKSKLQEIDKLKIKKIALFLEEYKLGQRKKIYKALVKSRIKEIPLVHARHDMEKEEYLFLIKHFKVKYFNLHKGLFQNLQKLNGLHHQILFELSYHNTIGSKVDVSKIAGFCIDLSHFKASEERWTTEFEYVLKRETIRRYFIANHLNGYSEKKERDVHNINSLSEFNYLKTLPSFLFGKFIALEVSNSIKDQIKFKKYITKLLK